MCGCDFALFRRPDDNISVKFFTKITKKNKKLNKKHK